MNKVFIGGAFYNTGNEDKLKFDIYTQFLIERFPTANIVAPEDIAAFKNNFIKTNLKATNEQIATAMVNFDLEQVRTADLLVVDLSISSTGLGLELGVALEHQKMVKLFAKQGSKISDMIIGAFKNKIVYYIDLNDLKKKLKNNL